MKYLVFILFFFSCAWNQKDLEQLEDFQGHQAEEFLDELDLEKEVADKFRVDDEKKKEIAEKKPSNSVASKTKTKKNEKKEVKEKVNEEVDPKFSEYDENSKNLWKKSQANIKTGENVVYDVEYAGLTIGKVAMSVGPQDKIQGRSVYHMSARLKSAPFYSYIYEIDDKVETFVDMEKFLPIKFSLIQNESNKVVNDLQLFDWDKSKTYFRYKKVKNGQASYKKKDVVIPKYFQDSFSAIYFMRSLPLKIGDKYQFPVVTRGKIWLMDIKIDNIETIDTEIGKKESIKAEVVTRYEGDVVKKGVMTFWLSNDSQKLLLKFKAEVKIGSIRGSIVSFQQ